MKIALVSPYDFAYPGGVVNHISCLEKRLTSAGHEVKIIAPASKAVYTLGERFIRIGTPRPIPVSGSIARVTVSPYLDKTIKEVFRREKFDICHLHEPLMPMLCTTVLRLKLAPMVGTFHAAGGRPSYRVVTPVGKWYFNRWFGKLDGKIAVSRPAMSYINSFFPGEYDIIPNGVDTCHFCPDAPPLDRFRDGKLNILFVGRMERRKGFNYLLKAYQQIKREFPGCRLIAVGPGTRLRRLYENWANRKGLEDVVFCGYADYNELPAYYQTADIVCFPATGRESFGIVLLEAMAVGKPVVASCIEGYNTILTDGAEGLSVAPRDPARLAEAILKLLNDEALRREMGERGRLRAMEFDWDNVARRVLGLYTATLNGKAAGGETAYIPTAADAAPGND